MFRVPGFIDGLDDCNSYSEVMFIGAVNAEDKDWI